MKPEYGKGNVPWRGIATLKEALVTRYPKRGESQMEET